MEEHPRAEPVLGVGGGEPCTGGGGAEIRRMAAVSAGWGLEPEAAAGRAAPAAADAAAARLCGNLAICPSRSLTDCGRWAGSFASTLARRTSSSSGRTAFSLAAEGMGALTVE